MKISLEEILSKPYKNYIYSYPHKKAYRNFEEPIDLKELWKNSSLEDFTLYIHIPFCMNKCGYCNLFSSTYFNKQKITKYVDKLIEEIKAVKKFLVIDEGINPFSTVILGGGTPTILEDYDLKRLLDALSNNFYIDFKKVFFAIETSPRTITESKLDILKEYWLDRISMGIQSFEEIELSNIFRMEKVLDIEKALDYIFKYNIPIKNLDLIYGILGQTLETWKESLKRLLKYKPEEIFIYPLYIRERTSLYSKFERDTDKMLNMYDLAREMLQKHGYIQTSMRNFVREDMKNSLFPKYSCQENEMIGIGCGARSYIGNIHYSRNYAVGQKNINSIIDSYMEKDDFSTADYGYILNENELKRRYILKSILKITGLNINDYIYKFKKSPLVEFKELNFLIENGFLIRNEQTIYPTSKGLMYSDSIGEFIISDEIIEKIKNFDECIF